jgi:hypothetical protein
LRANGDPPQSIFRKKPVPDVIRDGYRFSEKKMRPPKSRAGHAQRYWYGLMAAGGLLFGLLGDNRPFGTSVLVHPFVIFFVIVAAALLILRVARGRPVPELIPERTLVIGCFVGGISFLAGNWMAAHLPVGWY